MLKDSNVVEGPPPTTSRHDDFAGAPPACNPVDSAPASSGKRSGTTASRGEGKMPKVPRVSPGGAEALEASPVEDPERVAHPRTGPEARDTVIVRGLPPNLCLACKKGSPQPVALPRLSPWHNLIGVWHPFDIQVRRVAGGRVSSGGGGGAGDRAARADELQGDWQWARLRHVRSGR